MARRCFVLLFAMGLLGGTVWAQLQGRRTLSRPEGDTVWGITRNGTNYCVIPYELIDRLSHKKLRKLIGGTIPGTGFMFFIVTIDNTKGKEPVEFSAFSASVTLHCVWPTMEDTARYDIVDLRNYFLDPDNVPEEKEAFEKVKAMFKTDLTIPPGKTAWSLIAIRDTFSFEHCSRAEWAFPGGPPRKLPKQKFSPAILKRCKVITIPWDHDF